MRESGLEGAAVHEGGRRRAAEVCEGGGEVYIERYLVRGPAGGNARSPHGQGHPDRLFVGGTLDIENPVLAHQEAVVRSEKDVGVLERALRFKLLHHTRDEVVEGREQSEVPAVHPIYVCLLVRAQTRELADPPRLI